MMPADNDVRLPRTDGLQKARIRAIPAIDNRHIARVEVIMLPALAFLRLADEDLVPWEMHHMDGQVETVIGTCGTWALYRSPIA